MHPGSAPDPGQIRYPLVVGYPDVGTQLSQSLPVCSSYVQVATDSPSGKGTLFLLQCLVHEDCTTETRVPSSILHDNYSIQRATG